MATEREPGGLGGWLLRRRLSRIALIAGLFPLGILSILSGALVVFVAELRGWRVAMADSLIALAILLLATAFMQRDLVVALIGGGSTWLVAVGVGELLGRFASMTLALQALLVLAVVGILLFAALLPDPVAFWEKFIRDFAEQMMALGVDMSQPELLMPLATIMPGVVGASLVISSAVAMMVGSLWASRAGGPPFRQMFIRIRLGYVIGGVTLLVSIIALASDSWLASSLLIVLGVGFLFQGLSVVQWHIVRRGWPGTALLALFAPFLLGPPAMLLELFVIAAVGFVDNWFNLRREV